MSSENLDVSDLKPETVATFKNMCNTKPEFLRHLAKFGNEFERAAAELILNVGGKLSE